MPGSHFFRAKRPLHSVFIIMAQIAALVLVSATWLPAQQSVSSAVPQKAAKQNAEARPAEGKPKSNADDSEPLQTLVQLNNALESLAARVSPAVVQILVTGYGPLREREEDRAQTALIVRQHR